MQAQEVVESDSEDEGHGTTWASEKALIQHRTVHWPSMQRIGIMANDCGREQRAQGRRMALWEKPSTALAANLHRKLRPLGKNREIAFCDVGVHCSRSPLKVAESFLKVLL